jgi:phosphoserine aminotransferase
MMAARPFNFAPGPSMLPEPVLRQAAADILDCQGSGVGVMEMSHRGREFTQIFERCEARVRELLAVPAHYKVLFMQGGAIGANAIVPMNLVGRRPDSISDHVVLGTWSRKTLVEARRYGDARVAASNDPDEHYRHLTLPPPATWDLSVGASYVHLCSNETINGIEVHEMPDLAALGSDAPLVIDCSSHIASRPIDWSRVALAYAGAQKNIGPAGLTLVIVREDLIGHALPICPSAFDYAQVAAHGSMYNTPPVFAIYVMRLVLAWLVRQGGLDAIQRANARKADKLYAEIDRTGFYRGHAQKDSRSRMNVTFRLPSEELEKKFVKESTASGFDGLKGHRSVGGLRASIYNAFPEKGVDALVQFMEEFDRRNG